MASVAGSKGGINDKLKKKLKGLRKENTKRREHQDVSKGIQQRK